MEAWKHVVLRVSESVRKSVFFLVVRGYFSRFVFHFFSRAADPEKFAVYYMHPFMRALQLFACRCVVHSRVPHDDQNANR